MSDPFLYVQSTSEVSVKRASMLSDMHFRNLRQKMLLKQRTEEAARKLEVAASSCHQTPVLFDRVCSLWTLKLELTDQIL